MLNFTVTEPDVLRDTPSGATGVTRFTIFAGVTSTAGAGAAGAGVTTADPVFDAAALCTAKAWVAESSGDAAVGAFADPRSDASMVRPLKLLLAVVAVVVGGALIGASSGITAWRGCSPIGAPNVRCGDAADSRGRDADEDDAGERSAARGVDRSGARSTRVRSASRGRSTRLEPASLRAATFDTGVGAALV